MFKLIINKISVFLIIMVILLLIVSSGYCGEAKYQFNATTVNPLFNDGGIILQLFAASVRYATDGEVDIKIYVAGEWGGSEEEYCQSVQYGNLDIASVITAPISQYTNALFMFDVPFLFQNTFDELLLTFESVKSYTPIIVKKLEQASKEANFMVLAVAPSGRRNTSLNKPIESIADLKGMKIRVMNSPIQVDSFNFMGAIATPMPFSEVFMALKLNILDAYEGPPIDYIDEKFYEVAPYHIVTDHFAGAMTIIMSMKAWDSLPTAYQNIVRECAIGVAHTISLWGSGSYDYYLGSIIPGVAKSVMRITPEEKAELRAMVLPKLLDKYSEQIGMDVLEAIGEGDELITDWLAKNK